MLRDLEKSFSSLKRASYPYFQEAFEALCQYQVFNEPKGLFDNASLLSLLANRPTKSMFTLGEPSIGAGLIACIQRITCSSTAKPTMVPMRNALPVLLMQKL